MKHLGSIRTQDIVPGAPVVDTSDYPYRESARAVLFDGDRVLLIYVAKDKSYKLPGGGLEPGEANFSALRREVLEETGYRIADVQELGETLEYKDSKPERQRSLCYMAHIVGVPLPVQLTDEEQALGVQAIWVGSLQKAITLLENAQPTTISSRFIRHRELLFLRAAQATDYA